MFTPIFSLGLTITDEAVRIAVPESKMNDLRQLALSGPWKWCGLVVRWNKIYPQAI
jgi:hypothetical protein